MKKLISIIAISLFTLIGAVSVSSFASEGNIYAKSAQVSNPTLEYFLKVVPLQEVYPNAERYELNTDAKPPYARVYGGDKALGYVYLNSDIVNARGYSAKPIHILIAIANDGTIMGAQLVKHDEPIVLIGIPQAKIEHFIDAYIGKNYVKNPPKLRSKPPADIISGATVTVMVIGDTITRSAVALGRKWGLGDADKQNTVAQASEVKQEAQYRVNMDIDTLQSWHALLDEGSVAHMHLTVGDVNQAFRDDGEEKAAEHAESSDEADTFIDLYLAPVSQPSIGRSLLGEAQWNLLQKRLKPGQQAILVAGEGAYSFKGSGYVRGGVFDRIEIIQGTDSFRFRDLNHQRLGDIMADNAPHLREIALFTVPDNARFDLTRPWDLQLMVQRVISVKEKAFITFDLHYQLPKRYLEMLAPAQESKPNVLADKATDNIDTADEGAEKRPPLWLMLWQKKIGQITVLSIAVIILFSVFFFQDWFAKRPVFYSRFRTAYLVFVLFYIGFYCMAQLSVVNVLTFSHALMSNFNWEYFLMDPLIFILWTVTAITTLLWDRGVFCGWLCPFGALQELLNKLARKLGIRQWNIPYRIHERLTAIKYLVFMFLFAVSLQGLGTAEKLAEIEPFKTSIILHFIRGLPFVLYALVLLGLGLVIERFYCRYLCPLGAALAIPARLRLFDWLKRYHECGNPCMRCHNECPVQAITPEGPINANECIQCLNCQVLYFHQTKCPHLIKKAARKAKYSAKMQKTPEKMTI